MVSSVTSRTYLFSVTYPKVSITNLKYTNWNDGKNLKFYLYGTKFSFCDIYTGQNLVFVTIS